MTKIFSIFGYGVPKNIMKDDNYRRYLSIAFNRIFDAVAGEKACILFCGGLTDCFKPYKRTEAREMRRYFDYLINRNFVRRKTNGWKLIEEKRSISGLENILYLIGYLKKNRIRSAWVYVFCEQTRKKRIKALFVFGRKKDVKLKSIKFSVVPVDFDTGYNRYLDKKFIVEKERKHLKKELWALKSVKNLREYRRWYERKLEFFRKNNYTNDPRVVERWWRMELG